MWVRNDTVWALALLFLSTASCSDSASPAKAGSSADSANTDDGEPTADDGTPAAPTRDAGKGTTTSSTSNPGTKPATGSTAQKDSGTAPVAAKSDAAVPSGTDPAKADGGAPAAAGDGGTARDTTPLDIPTPVTEPIIWGFGIGITDVAAATKFYTEVMKMTVEKMAVKRDDSTETVLYGTQAKRGARMVLMNFDDMRNTRKITAKIVWQAQDSGAVDTAASKYPDYVSRIAFPVVQFDGPDTYIHEVGGSFDDGGAGISVPYPIALGFVVSDLAASRKFYAAIGMAESSVGTFPVTDATGMATITEYSFKFPTGSGIVLQQWSGMRNAKNNPVKVVLQVPDAKALGDKVVAAGGAIVKPAERLAAYDNRLVVIAKDLDGYLLELVQ